MGALVSRFHGETDSTNKEIIKIGMYHQLPFSKRTANVQCSE